MESSPWVEDRLPLTYNTAVVPPAYFSFLQWLAVRCGPPLWTQELEDVYNTYLGWEEAADAWVIAKRQGHVGPEWDWPYLHFACELCLSDPLLCRFRLADSPTSHASICSAASSATAVHPQQSPLRPPLRQSSVPV